MFIKAKKVYFKGFSFKKFWNDSEYALNEYVSPAPSDELIESVEQELGYKLPASYIWLMKRHNGGMPVNNFFITDSFCDNRIEIAGVYGIGREKDNSLCGALGSKYMIDEWQYPAVGVAVCDCPSAGHDMVFLDYRECGPQGEPAVVHIDQEADYKITRLADNFEAFIRGLVNENYNPEENETSEDMRTVKYKPFSPILLELCQKSGESEAIERKIRKIAVQIVEKKEYFALHDDELSWLLYDIQFWLYENAYPNVTQEEYLEVYPEIIALSDGFAQGSYTSLFIEEWLKSRKATGDIQSENGALTMSEAAKARLKQRLQAIE